MSMTGNEFKQRFLPLSRKLFSVALGLMGNVQDAEDIVQEAYIKLWTMRDALPEMLNAEAYCVTLTKHICYDRQRNTHGTVLTKPAEELRMAAAGDTEEAMETHDYAEIMKRCIWRLPEQQRLLVTMRDIDGLSYDEIGRMTGLGTVNIRVTLSRARKALREQFDKIRNYEGK